MTNPLLKFSYNFDFSALKPEHIKPAIETHIAEARKNLQAIIGLNTPRTFENTMVKFERSAEGLDFAYTLLSHIESVATYPEYRKEFNAIQGLASDFYSSIYLDAGLYKAIKDYAATAEANSLKPAQKRFLEKVLKAFKKNGAELDAKGKDRITKINAELTEITTRFSQNALDSTNEFEWITTDRESLKGLPESALSAAEKAALDKGKTGFRFTLQYPSFRAIVLYHSDSKIRELFYRAFNNRATKAPFENTSLIVKILDLRTEKARLLGYKDFSDFTTEDRMAGSGKSAEKFLVDLVPVVKEQYHRELKELTEFRRELEGPKAPPLRAWDIGYYSEKLRQKVCNYDPEKLRPYFNFDSVLKGLFEVASKLFGISIHPVDGFKSWDKEVRTFEVKNKDSSIVGHFFTDYFPRENKRAGAWMDTLIAGVQGRQGRERGLAFMAGNFTHPLGDAPSLLTHEEVRTLFHETGHLLHGLLGKVELASQGINGVAWDFVELPSQFFENWCWKKEALALFAKHYQTGAALPGELFDSMLQARNFQKGMFYVRQLGLGILDMSLHVHYNAQRDGDVLEYSRKILKDFMPDVPEDFALINSFGHIFGGPVGYAAGYYSYLWAEVLEADAFSRFEKEGIFNQTVGLEFRRAILEKGDSEPPQDLFGQFMKRNPDPKAMLRRAGLVN